MTCVNINRFTRISGPFTKRSLAAFCSFCLFSTGCASRSLRNIPAANAPLEERIEAYQRLRASSLESVSYRQAGTITLGNPPPDKYVLELANGARVKNPRRLLKLVLPDSKTAREAKEYQKISRKAWISYGAAGAGVGVGMGLTVLGFPFGERDANNGLIITGAVLFVAAMVPALIGRHFKMKASERSYEAFRTYDSDLRTRLRIRSNPDAYRYEYE